MPVLRGYQERACNWLKTKRRGIVQIPAGGGKCLGKGTPVLKFSGEICAVENIRVGDELMGPDSTPRRVTSITRGTEPLYRVDPVKGDSYVVNESHILSLKVSGLHPGEKISGCGQRASNGEVMNICVRDLLRANKHQRMRLKGWRTGVEFRERRLNKDVPPYLLGMWLGDGNSNGCGFSTMDEEIVTVLAWHALQSGLILRKSINLGKCPMYFLTIGSKKGKAKSNIFRDGLAKIGVLNNKHIPHAYLTSSMSDRLDLLAGIMDTDGCKAKTGFDYISKLECLADGVCFLARSLGLAAYKTRCNKSCSYNGTKFVGEYFRVYISGDCSIVPCRIPRKRTGPRNQKKSVLVTGIKITPIGVGEYFGFELSGPDRLFLLGDFTVTHNTIVASEACRRVTGVRDFMPSIVWMANTVEQCAQARIAIKATGADKTNSFVVGCPTSTEVIFAAATCDLIIVDEAHHSPAPTWRAVIESAKNARWAFSATPFCGDEERDASMRELFGDAYFFVGREELVDAGNLANGRVIMVEVSNDTALSGKIESQARATAAVQSKRFRGCDPVELLQRARWTLCARYGIAENEERNALIVELAHRHLHESTLILVQQVEHGKALSECIPFSVVCHSGMGKRKRREAIEGFRDGSVKHMIATSLADEGLDVPRASVLILASAGRSAGKLEQRTGRVLRAFEEKGEGLIYDFQDSAHFMLRAQSNARRKVYAALGYSVSEMGGVTV